MLRGNVQRLVGVQGGMITPVRRTLLLVLAALPLLVANACTFGEASGSGGPLIPSTVAASTPGQGDCPQDLAHVRTGFVHGTTHVLVPGHPDSFTYCQNGTAAPSTDQAATERTQAALDALQVLTVGNAGCSAPNLKYGVFFHYPSGEVVLVRYGFEGGCPLATNGSRVTNMTDAVQQVILGSVGRG